MSLTQAIDEAVDFVCAHSDQMTRAEMDEFQRLTESVYVSAFRAKLTDALPKVSELIPQLESSDPPLPPVQFESKLHLPGDWDPVLPPDGERPFLVCASPRWFHDMEVLRSLAETAAAPEADLDWEKFKKATKRSPKQYELARVLIDKGDWIEFLDLAELVWKDEFKEPGAIAQQIKRTNKTMEKIGARVRIRRDGERAIADIF